MSRPTKSKKLKEELKEEAGDIFSNQDYSLSSKAKRIE